MGKFIMKYITQKKFRTFSKVNTKISRRLIERNKKYRKFASLEGLVITDFNKEYSPRQPEAFFDGNTYLLIDNETFSSASDFAAMFRDYECGEIIGYETGGLALSFGDNFSLTLKNSNIPFTVSFKKFYGPRPKPGDDEHGILPHMGITDEILKKFKNHEDPILAFTLERIRNMRKN